MPPSSLLIHAAEASDLAYFRLGNVVSRYIGPEERVACVARAIKFTLLVSESVSQSRFFFVKYVKLAKLAKPAKPAKLRDLSIAKR